MRALMDDEHSSTVDVESLLSALPSAPVSTLHGMRTKYVLGAVPTVLGVAPTVLGAAPAVLCHAVAASWQLPVKSSPLRQSRTVRHPEGTFALNGSRAATAGAFVCLFVRAAS